MTDKRSRSTRMGSSSGVGSGQRGNRRTLAKAFDSTPATQNVAGRPHPMASARSRFTQAALSRADRRPLERGRQPAGRARVRTAAERSLPKAVLQDSPLLYYRAGERAACTQRTEWPLTRRGTVTTARSTSAPLSGRGALPGNEDAAIYGNGQVVFQSGDNLPAASAPRTLEFWVHDMRLPNQSRWRGTATWKAATGSL